MLAKFWSKRFGIGLLGKSQPGMAGQEVARPVRNSRGMSLIEIIIVMGLIASVIAFLMNRIFGGQDKAYVNQAKSQIGTIAGQLELYSNDCGSYPTSEQGLAALLAPPTLEPLCGNWGPNPYIKEKDLKDPWKIDFVYESDGATYVIKSLGKDRREGGEGVAKDISSEDN